MSDHQVRKFAQSLDSAPVVEAEDGTTVVIKHGLGTQDIAISFYGSDGNQTFGFEIVDDNTISAFFPKNGTARPGGRVVVLG